MEKNKITLKDLKLEVEKLKISNASHWNRAYSIR